MAAWEGERTIRRADRWLRPTRRGARVRVDAEGIHADGVLLARRSGIARAHLQPARQFEPALLRVSGKRGTPTFDIELSDVEDGARLLAALGLGAVRFRAGSHLRATLASRMLVHLLVFLSFALAIALVPYVSALAFPIAFLPMLLVLFPSTITVGADGVLTSWLGVKRFYPYDAIEEVWATDGGVVLRFTSGQTSTIVTTQAGRASSNMARMDRDAVLTRIEEARRAFREHRLGDAGAIVARAGRDVRGWLASLRAIAGGGDYRQPTLPPDVLWRVAEDPTAAPSARVGAAIALRGAMDDAGRERLRVAAEGSASPKVRLALQAAASASDDGDLVDVLEDLEEEARRRSVTER
jgi:hypothetical protein